MDILTVNYQAPNAAERFAESLKNTGFAVITNHPISKQEIENLYRDWYQFFTSDEKFDYLFNKDSQDGFFPFEQSETAVGHSLPDLKEFYHAYPWGKMPERLRDDTIALYYRLTSFAAQLLTWLEQNTPAEIRQNLSMPLSEMIKDSERTLLRILHYPPLADDVAEGAVRAAAHEDINLITILPAATASGLQVEDREGNWHDVPCEHGMIVVNAADMLQMATEHFYRSTTHRVINPAGSARKTSRLSLPLFLHPRDEVALSTTHTATEYRLQRLKEIGLVE